MRDSEFAKIFMIKHNYLYIEIVYKQELLRIEKYFKTQLKEIRELISSDQSNIRQSTLGYGDCHERGVFISSRVFLFFLTSFSERRRVIYSDKKTRMKGMKGLDLIDTF